MPDRTIRKAQGIYPVFARKGGSAPRATHYCPGCGHGILHKLIGEALAELGLQDRAIVISPVGCAVFAYYYLDCGNVQAAHGRACAVGTGLVRSLDHPVIVSYQGDGDLASIGFNQTFQAANRGEKLIVFFLNNAVYGMTGGQMAPTTLIGQKTITSPAGRDPAHSGHPVHICELLNILTAPLYLERCSLADFPRIQKARRAIRHALEIGRDNLGFALVEFLSPCPTNFRKHPEAANAFVRDEMEKEFPLGCFRDKTKELPHPAPVPPVKRLRPAELFAAGADSDQCQTLDPSFGELRIKIAGHGGQGILRMGIILAEAAQKAGRHVSWLPSYGPEQRGGTANCSVVISGQPIGSPLVFRTNLLIAMNQSALERFAPDVAPGGAVLYETATCPNVTLPQAKTLGVPALDLATQAGSPQVANTAMLGALAASGFCRIPTEYVAAALRDAFGSKAAVLALNEHAFAAAGDWCRDHPVTGV